ncbi:hypothetical protein J9303_19125 [Bacillaceae bacterium Marseille-Q3522]|nr:hypothetical protein [Bacillaceae bacterium Marseille-Q3522]
MVKASKKILFWLLIASITLALAISISFYIFRSSHTPKELTAAEKNAAEEKVEKMTAEMEQSISEENLQDELTNYQTMTENEILQEIHNMSHQKVEADEKWGFSLITPEKVEKLYEVIEKSDFKYRDKVLSLLQPWLQGDFSNAVTVHNEIWELQDGTIGKATRLLTAVEEVEYLQEQQ